MISVVIPTRNRPDLLQRAVRSVLDQTHPHFEVIVIDDASEVHVAKVLQSDDRVRVYRCTEPVGPARARNLGATMAIGTTLAFLDDDDIYLPTKLERSVACLDQHPDAGFLAHLVRPPGRMVRSAPGRCRVVAEPVRRMLTQQPPHPDGLVVRNSIHARVQFDESFPGAEDLDYCLRLALCSSMVELDEILAEHGPSSESDSLVAIEARIEGRLMFREKHRKLFENPEFDSFYELRLGHQFLRLGSRYEALRHFVRSLSLDWRNPSAWKGLVAVMLSTRLKHRWADRGS